MVEPKQPEDRVWVAFVEKMAIIRVEGRGSFKVGTALKQFGQSAAEQGCVAAVLDMTSCVGMDSTFMGVLAGMATRLKDSAGDSERASAKSSTRRRFRLPGLRSPAAA